MSEENRLGQLLKTAREDMGLRQADVAEALFISDKAYSKIETGKNGLSAMHIPPLCKTLNLDVHDLFCAIFDAPSEIPGMTSFLSAPDNAVSLSDFRFPLADKMMDMPPKEHVLRVCLISGIIARLLNFDEFGFYADGIYNDNMLTDPLDMVSKFRDYNPYREMPYGCMFSAWDVVRNVVSSLECRYRNTADVRTEMFKPEIGYLDRLLDCGIKGHDAVVKLIDHYTSDYHFIADYEYLCRCSYNLLKDLPSNLNKAFDGKPKPEAEDMDRFINESIIEYVTSQKSYQEYRDAYLPALYRLSPVVYSWSSTLFSLTMEALMNI